MVSTINSCPPEVVEMTTSGTVSGDTFINVITFPLSEYHKTVFLYKHLTFFHRFQDLLFTLSQVLDKWQMRDV